MYKYLKKWCRLDEHFFFLVVTFLCFCVSINIGGGVLKRYFCHARHVMWLLCFKPHSCISAAWDRLRHCCLQLLISRDLKWDLVMSLQWCLSFPWLDRMLYKDLHASSILWISAFSISPAASWLLPNQSSDHQ